MDRRLPVTPPDALHEDVAPFATWGPDCVRNAASESWRLDSSARRDSDVLGVPPPVWDAWLKALSTSGTPVVEYIRPVVATVPSGRRYGREIQNGDAELWHCDHGVGTCAALAPPALSRLDGWGCVVENKAATTRTISPRYLWWWGDGKWLPRERVRRAASDAGVPIDAGPPALLEAVRQAFVALSMRRVVRGRAVTSATHAVLSVRFLLPILTPTRLLERVPRNMVHRPPLTPPWWHLPVFHLLDTSVQRTLLAYRESPTRPHWMAFRQAVTSVASNAFFHEFGQDVTPTLLDPSTRHRGEDWDQERIWKENAFDEQVYKTLLARMAKELVPRTFAGHEEEADEEGEEKTVPFFADLIFGFWRTPEGMGDKVIEVSNGLLPPDPPTHGDS